MLFPETVNIQAARHPLDRKGVLPMYTPAFLETLRQLEETLQFPAFDLEDAYALGTRLREAGTREP